MTTTPKTAASKNAAIDAIVRDILGLETLEPRRRDSMDFHELSVWQIKEALEAAFEAGRQTSR